MAGREVDHGGALAGFQGVERGQGGCKSHGCRFRMDSRLESMLR
jgi:hypothetical protein